MPRIASTSLALPSHTYAQAEARSIAESMFGDLNGASHLYGVFDRSGVESRRFAFPASYYSAGHPFSRRNDDYVRVGLELGERAVTGCLGRLGLAPRDVDHFFFVTTTGLATPSLDALLAHRLGMRADVLRTPLFGVGCAGGAVGLARAADYLRAHPSRRAVLLSVELCGQTFLADDRSPTNVVGTALFGDGAAAVLLEGQAIRGSGPSVVASRSHLFAGTEGLMGWDFTDAGFRLNLSPRVPPFLGTHVVPELRRFVEDQGASLGGVRHFALHPGGRRVIEILEAGLGVSPGALAATRASLLEFGNLSSAAVLFVLDAVLAGSGIQSGDLGLVAAVGPGFAAEMLLLRWESP